MAARQRNKPQTGPRARGDGKADPKAAKAAREAQEARQRAMDSKIHVDGDSYRLGDLTLGELGELEDHVGLPMDLISYNSAKTIAFVVYLVRRRRDPDYSLEDAQNIRIDAIGGDAEAGAVASVGGEERPT